MTIQQLHIFDVLCQEMNYTRAADRLYMTRQAVRQNISAMESELGGTLFDNCRNHISLTEKGKLLLHESAPVLKSFSEMMEHMYADINISVPINIGISVSLIPDFLPELNQHIENFRSTFNNVSIRILELENDEVVERVQSGELAIGLIMDLGSPIKDMERYNIIDCTLSVMVEKHHRLWNSAPIFIRDLNGETIQAPGMSDAFKPLFDKIKKEHLDIKIEISPHYYQVYYKVRDTGILGLNRYFPPENGTPHSNCDVLLKDAPPLCASVITCEKQSGIPNLNAFIAPFVNDLKEYYKDEPFARKLPDLTPSGR